MTRSGGDSVNRWRPSEAVEVVVTTKRFRSVTARAACILRTPPTTRIRGAPLAFIDARLSSSASSIRWCRVPELAEQKVTAGAGHGFAPLGNEFALNNASAPLR